jgi:hypothetical protein
MRENPPSQGGCVGQIPLGAELTKAHQVGRKSRRGKSVARLFSWFEPDLSRGPALGSTQRRREYRRGSGECGMISDRWVAAQIRRVNIRK